MFNDVRILKMQKLASIGSLHASAYLYILGRKPFGKKIMLASALLI